MAVPPNLVTFTESAGLAPVVSYGPDSQKQLDSEVFRKWWTLRNPITVLKQARDYASDGWDQMNDALTLMAKGAQVIVSGTTYQELAANVAEAKNIPFAALHMFPARANTHVLPGRLPLAVVKHLYAAAEWAHWRLLKPAYDRQRHTLRLPVSRVRAARRIVESGALEIQAYDKALFPGLEEEWGGRRPLVGSPTLGLTTVDDDLLNSWISSGPPPIYFGFGSMPIGDPAKAVEMIVETCRRLGERALICSGVLALEGIASTTEVMVVPAARHADVFPRCRAIVHHGGCGTTAASVRAGVPTLVLWVGADQPLWGLQIKRLGVGTSRRFSATTPKTLLDDLRTVLGPACAERARDVASQMTAPRGSVTATADLLERHAARRA